MAARDRRAMGIAIALIALPIALASFVLGHMVVGGWDNADTQCAYIGGQPPVPIVERGESGADSDGGWSLLPLGITCTFDEAGDGIPAQTVVHANWSATLAWLAASITVVTGLAMAIAPGRMPGAPAERATVPVGIASSP